jgi:E3 ubiquitin-protein ligase HECTD2
MWWTGDRRKSTKKGKEAEGSHSSTERRSLRLDLNAVHQWYDAIFSCGKKWRLQRSLLPDESRAALEWPEEDQLLEQRIAEGRYHVQRTFLKSIENLLRRPGRPIKDPEDCRFLLILLLNPLLYPHPVRKWPSESHTRAQSLSQVDSLQREASMSGPRRSVSGARGGATGVHSGLIKRILGLISKSSFECHQAVIMWLCKVPDTLFRDIVELINGFVTYRLGRQNGRNRSNSHDPTGGLIPDISGPGAGTSAQLHAQLGSTSRSQSKQTGDGEVPYGNDWQVRAAAKVMALVFGANIHTKITRIEGQKGPPEQVQMAARMRANRHAQRMPTSAFYNSMLDQADLVADFETWEMRSSKFCFCQYPMFLSIWSKIRIMEHDARRPMEVKARDAFFTSIMSRKAVSQYLVLRVRRDCLVDDSLRSVSEVVGTGEEEIKKGLRIEFVGEEGVDAGG